MISLINKIIRSDLEGKAEVTMHLESTHRWVRKVKFQGMKDGVVFFLTTHSGKTVSSATYLDNISDIAIIWASNVAMLENDLKSEFVDKKEKQELPQFFMDDEDDGDEFILNF
mgnify:CR=1 FL=1